MTKINILVINGPNLNMLGKRDSNFYGTNTLKDLEKMILEEAEKKDVNVSFFTSDSEGEIIKALHDKKYDSAIINAGAYSHYSIAIRDAIECCGYPVIEVHISNIYAREEFRQKSVISPVCAGTISGFGFYGYILSFYGCLEKINKEKNK